MLEKYLNLPSVVSTLDPSEVAQIFQCATAAGDAASVTYFPKWGMFFTEFSLGYCQNLPTKHAPSRRRSRKTTCPPDITSTASSRVSGTHTRKRVRATTQTTAASPTTRPRRRLRPRRIETSYAENNQHASVSVQSVTLNDMHVSRVISNRYGR